MLLEGHNASEFAELQGLDSVYAWEFLQLKTNVMLVFVTVSEMV